MEEFWKKYINADVFERGKIISRTITPKIIDVINMDIGRNEVNDQTKHMIDPSLQGYFDDLISVMNNKKKPAIIKKIKEVEKAIKESKKEIRE